MYKDSHVHTKISHDGKSKITEYLVKALFKNIDEITFAEHWDIYDGLEGNILKPSDIDNYYRLYKEAQGFHIKGLNINFGIEIGLQPDIKEQVDNLVNKYPFDFIIGSSHITCKKDIAQDKSYFEGISRKKAYLKYFQEILENIDVHNNFDVYGHLDYIIRYGGSKKPIEYKEFNEILDEILKGLIKKDKGLEVNTSGYRYGFDTTHPNIEIIKRYKELGGKIVTIGSDAHHTDYLGDHFAETYEMLKSININELAIYRKRVPHFYKI